MWKVKNNFGFEESESVTNNTFLNEYYNNIYNVHELQSQQSTYTNKSDNAYLVYDTDNMTKISDILSIAQAKLYFMDKNSGCYRELDSSSDFQIDAIEKTITIITDEIGTETVQSFDIIGLNDLKNDINFEGMDGSGFAIAVLDTGIDLNHSFFGPDENNDGISDRIVYSYDFTDEGDNTADDTNGHGTNVSSISASSDTQYAGVASGADIVALQVLKANGSGAIDGIENALQWLIANGVQYNIVAVNMSIGWFFVSEEYTSELSDEFATLKSMGIMVVLAAGNSYHYYQEEGVSALAADPSVISVGAVYDANVGMISYADGAIDYTTDENRITSFSARSETMVDIFAPGALITGAGIGGGLSTAAGTSQATPHIAGLVALAQEIAMRDLGRLLTQDEFISLMVSTGTNIIDGDDEDDNVINTGKTYEVVNVYEFAKAIQSLDDNLNGTNGDDVINGTDFGDIIYGFKGNDIINGNGGNDIIDGGAGNDTLNGGTGIDTVTYESSTVGVTVNLALTTAQTIQGTEKDTIIDVENLTGSSYNDTLIGNSLNNILEGGLGNDTLNGGTGIDTVTYENSTSKVIVNLITTTAQNTVGEGIDTLNNFENIIGSDYNDTLIGNNVNNVLEGGLGNDTLNGGTGNDTLIGGEGEDVFVFNASIGISNQDTIVDFNYTEDKIHLDNGVFISLGLEGILNPEFFKDITSVNGVTVYRDSNDYLLYNRDTGNLFYDADGGATKIGAQPVAHFSSFDGLYPLVDASCFVVAHDTNDSPAASNDVVTVVEDTIYNGTLPIYIDEDGDSVTYSLNTNASNGTVTISTDGTYAYVPTANYNGIDSFAYTINDGHGGINTYTVSITVTAVNDPLNLTVTPATTITEGSTSEGTVVATISASDVDGGDIIYSIDDTTNYTISTTNGIVVLTLAGATIVNNGFDLPAFNVTAQSTIGLTSSNTVNIILPTTTDFKDGTINGTNGDDVINGTDFGDIMYGFEGNDIINGNGGNDILEGGLGNDTLNGEAGIDTVTYQNSTVGVTVNLALTAAQTIQGTEKDTITGVENIIGSNYNDILKGSTLSNAINGLDGNDTIVAGTGKTNDIFDGGNGIDTISYEQATSLVTIDLSNTSSQVTMGSGSDTLTNFENLTGSNYNDTLTGNDNDNTIMGGAGNDILTGGEGEDIFVFNAAIGTSNQDTISDFEFIQDKIYLENSIFSQLGVAGILNPDFFKDLTPVNGQVIYRDANDYLLYNRDTGNLFYDADGGATKIGAQLVAHFNSFDGLYPLVDASCFVVI